MVRAVVSVCVQMDTEDVCGGRHTGSRRTSVALFNVVCCFVLAIAFMTERALSARLRVSC